MDVAICFETAVGDSLLLVSTSLPAHQVPKFALKFAEVKAFIPGLTLVIAGHTLTEMTFTAGNCRLRGEKVHWHELSREVDDG